MKTFHQTILTLSLATISLFTSCQKDVSKPDIATGKIPDGFNFETSKKIDVNIRLLSTENEPLTGIIVDINNTTNGETLLRGVSDQNGYFKASVTIPAYMDTLLVNPNNTGLTQDIKTLVVNNALTCVISGTNGASGNIVMSTKGSNKTYAGSSSIFANTNFVFMGSYSSAGRPVNYLEPVKGVVSANLLTYLAESLPDNKDVRVHHPAYLTDNATEHLNITKTADVWVTFVSEGGNHANAIGYYTYTTGNPPNMASKIPTVRYIFPNCGGVGSGGAMQSGDRVKLGTFGPNTSIGFVLIQNGWRPTQNTVDSSYPKFYSDSPFNPENTAALKTHTVLLNYAPENLFIIGFEDLVRTGGDHDFNDVIIYANTVPTDAIGTAAVQVMAPPKDTDGDGVWDVNDKFPTDAARAYVSYFPSPTTLATVAFEDNWPAKGDYDMNDLVVNYRYTYISNSANKVVEMTGAFHGAAAIAQNQNGFGVQFPFASNLISSVTGQKLSDNYISQNANGTEAGQSKAVIIPFDNHRKVIDHLQSVDSAVVKIVFTQPIDLATLGTGPYNPFIICNRIRGIEAHLPGQLPTDKGDASFFGTQNDRTSIAGNKYYLSDENWPWAISFTESFRIPVEGNPINTAYLHFGEWATSGGSVFTDWYKNTAPGYRDNLKIY